MANTTPSAGHAGLGEDLRIHDDDVGHGHESSEAAEHLLSYGGLVFGELEIAIDQWFTLDLVRSS